MAYCGESPNGSLATHADLRVVSDGPWNEIVVDGRGNWYVNGAPGVIALIKADGSVRAVAEGIAFPNGMAITPARERIEVTDAER